MRYGFIEQAQRVSDAIIDAAEHFGYRLPELFCGFDRAEFAAPVPYPTSCSPQAWAAAAPLQLLHSLLRFAPEVSSGQLWCAPEVPGRYLPLRVSGLRVGKSRLSVDIGDGQWEISGLEPVSLEVIAGRRDLAVVGRCRRTLRRAEPGTHRRVVGEVQFGDPVVGLLAAIQRRDELASLESLQARNLLHQRYMHAQVVLVKRGLVLGLGVQDYQFHRHGCEATDRAEPAQDQFS
jgi:hypothetical protein